MVSRYFTPLVAMIQLSANNLKRVAMSVRSFYNEQRIAQQEDEEMALTAARRRWTLLQGRGWVIETSAAGWRTAHKTSRVVGYA